MKKLSMVAISLAASLLAVGTANATDTVVKVNGTLADAGAFSGVLSLDVENGVAVSGTGTFNLLSYSGSPISLITTSTPGNEDNSASYPGAPVGFRANDGTDYFGLDQAYPFDKNGLLFAVGTSVPAAGQNPILALYSNGDGTFGAQFTGSVAGTEYYNKSGSFTYSATTATSAVPEAGTWLMMILGFGAIGGVMRSAHRKSEERFTRKVRSLATA